MVPEPLWNPADHWDGYDAIHDEIVEDFYMVGSGLHSLRQA
jgi:hypothetical protein